MRGGVITTPQTEGSILPGVIRSKVIEVAEADGIPVAERIIRLADGLIISDTLNPNPLKAGAHRSDVDL